MRVRRKEGTLKAILQLALFLLTAYPLTAMADEGKTMQVDQPPLDGAAGKTRPGKLTLLEVSFPIFDPEGKEAKRKKAESGQIDPPYHYELPVDPVPNIEYFSLRAGGGLYGFGADAGVITLRWEKVYWDIIRGDVFLGGPSVGADDWFRGNFGILSGVGYPYSNGNHEFRAGGGIGYGFFYMGYRGGPCLKREVVDVYYEFVGGSTKKEMCTLRQRTNYSTPNGDGGVGKIELLYLYHFHKYFALEVGFTVYFQVWPLTPVHGTEPINDRPGEMFYSPEKRVTYLWPDPSPVLTIGFRI